MKKIAVAACFAVFAACNTGSSVKEGVKEAISKAYIFERKLLPDNKLLVSYVYRQGQSTVKDSSVMENSIILQDSIPVSLLAKNGR